MPRLTIVNLTGGPFVIQDPTGLYGFNMDIAASDTETADLSTAALAALEEDLDAAQTAGKITWSADDDPDTLADSVPENLRTALVTPVVVLKGEGIIVTDLTVAGAVAVQLPIDARIGEPITIVDGKGDAGANNITITCAGGTINGGANIVIGVNYGSVRLVCIAALTWAAVPTLV